MALKKHFVSENRVQLVNEQFRVIDLFQAYLPILMIVVLSVLLVYNLGYFYALDWHYLYLLRMADYYAGTLPLLAFILVLYSSLVYQALDVPYWPYQRLLEKLRRLGDEYDNLSEGMARAKETISGLWFSRLEKMSLRQQIWLTKGQNLLRSLRRKPGRKLSVDRLEKIAASEEAHYDKLLYQYELLKPRLKTDVKVLAIMAAKICGLSSLGALAVAGFYWLFLVPLYGTVWREKPLLFLWGMVITALLALGEIALQVSYRRRRWLLAFAAAWISFYCGILGFHQDTMQMEVNVIDTDDREHSLIRAVGKGYFVRDDKDVVFIPKENALRLEQHLKKSR